MRSIIARAASSASAPGANIATYPASQPPDQKREKMISRCSSCTLCDDRTCSWCRRCWRARDIPRALSRLGAGGWGALVEAELALRAPLNVLHNAPCEERRAAAEAGRQRAPRRQERGGRGRGAGGRAPPGPMSFPMSSFSTTIEWNRGVVARSSARAACGRKRRPQRLALARDRGSRGSEGLNRRGRRRARSHRNFSSHRIDDLSPGRKRRLQSADDELQVRKTGARAGD